MSKRIWNEKELRSLPNVRQGDFGTWIHKRTGEAEHDAWIDPSMVGKSLEEIKAIRPECPIADWMITEDKPQNNMKTVTLSNGTILEVGEKYRQNHWLKDDYIEVKFIDDNIMYTRTNNGKPVIHELCYNWLPYTAPQEEVEWKTFLIEFDAIGKDAMWRPATKEIVMMRSIEDVRNFYPEAISITEVEIEIKSVNN